MAKRIYEFSKEVGVPNKELLDILNEGGFGVSSHMSVLSSEAEEYLQSYLKKQEKQQLSPDKENISDQKKETLITQKHTPEPKKEKSSHEKRPAKRKPVISLQPERKEVPKKEPEPIGVRLEPMMVGDFADHAQRPASEVVLALLRQGIMATKNQVISAEVVEKLAQLFSVPILQPELPKKEEEALLPPSDLKEGRMPIIVIIGHVDHGKTTLLDYIRKTRVAEREKGGITQHLGAYEVQTSHGGLVFLDTPGHEAFSMMRARGVRVADIAILVVAADDSVMPQTIEAIKHAKLVNVPIIVAVNKIDKATPAQLEKVKQDLTQHELLPEEWGGQTVLVPISAKEGTGVDELLDMIVLQSQLLELQTNVEMPARGFVLESKVEKGLGPVATVISQYGTLSLGDFFRAGTVYGKVSALIDTAGNRIKKAGPSTPVLVAGFSSLPRAGDPFMVVGAEEIKKAKRVQAVKPTAQQAQPAEGEQVIRLVLKADNASSAEALDSGIKKLEKKLPEGQAIMVLQSSVGDITESDVILARDTGSIIYGFNVKPEGKAAAFASREKVTIKLFGIIYKLFEDIEEFAKKTKIIKMVSKKTGEAEVLKVFKIKGIGVIAGARVKSGSCVRDGNVEAYRGTEKIGSGPIKSLQREKQAAKEVQAGFECAFLVDGIEDWQPGDIIECYKEFPEE